ncbi:MAG: glycosyltransferase family 39 protein [Planctomycetota bacterium]
MLRRLTSETGLLLTVLVTGLWLAVAMPVFSQESYYWCYSQHPDLSYYDHPPMVAWSIWLGSHVFGNEALGIRVVTWLLGCTTAIAGLGLLRSFGARPAARQAWLVLCLGVPSLVAARFLTNPDPALCAFWMLTVLALWKAPSGHLGWWVLAGFLAGCALLSKYTAAFLAVGGAVVLLLDPDMRRQLRRPGPYVGVLVAVLTFLPVIWWNVANDFESFRFQTAGRWSKASIGGHWLLQFVGGQLAVINPFVALVVPAAALWLWRRGRDRDLRATWLLAFSAPMLLFLLANSMVMQVKINWATPALLTLLLGVAMWWSESDALARRPRLTRVAGRGALAIALLVLAAPIIVLFPQRRGSTWAGWAEIAACAEHWESVIDESDGVEGNVFFFAGDYRDAAQLTRGLELYVAQAEPDEVLEPVMAQNVVGRTALQFDHWTPPTERVGQDAIFVLPRPDGRDDILGEVRQHFRAIERAEHVVVQRLGIEVLSADVYVCRGYLGPQG